jgi:ribosome maturation factor RimP
VYRDIPEELRVLIEPVVTDAGFELVDALLTRGRAPWLLRVTIDTPEGDGRVAIERCADVSREIGSQLDAADAVPVAYRLEVSSPGLDRLLAREKDFRLACGSEVYVETRRALDGRRRFRGVLLDFTDGSVRLRVDASEVAIPFAEIAKAHRVYQFTREDFTSQSERDKAPKAPRSEAQPSEGGPPRGRVGSCSV